MTDWLRETAFSGTMLLAVPIAVFAGLLSFLSPCVLPLLPGYLSYTTGLSGADVVAGNAGRGRMLAGALLFVAGFTVVFVALGMATGGLARWLIEYRTTLNLVVGIFTIVLGLAFLGLVPILQRDVRFHRVPAVGLVAAPLLGVLFAVGWTPCVGPTLGVIESLALTGGTATRGGILLASYSLGLGIPFVLFALMWRRASTGITWLRRHQRTFTRVGGAFLIVIGLALLTGWWDYGVTWLQLHIVDQWAGVNV
jgi:cytochrome c-type biogenesis protein